MDTNQHPVPDVMPMDFESPAPAPQAPVAPTTGLPAEQNAASSEMFTPKVILICSFIAAAIIVALWVAGSHADTLTHKRVTGEDITTWESMFNGTQPGSGSGK
jgi:hypothetical protein